MMLLCMAEASKKAVEAARATAAAAAAGVKDLVCLFSSCVLVYIHIYSEMYFVPGIPDTECGAVVFDSMVARISRETCTHISRYCLPNG